MKAKKKMSLQARRDERNGFLFALPWIIGFLCFSVYPLIASLYYSFTEFNPVKDPVWVGLENYMDVFKDPLILKALKNTLFMTLVATPVNLFVAILLALVVTKNFKGRGITRTIFFMPSVIPMVAGTMVWIWMFDPTYGYINHILSWFGMQGPSWLMDANYTKWALLLMGTWNTGTTMLVCMNALNDVPTSYYESAELDGANAIQRFIYITLPCIAHVIVYQMILNMINSFQYFQQVNIIISASQGGGSNAGVASGGPSNSILMYPLYLYYTAFNYMKMGKASAMAWLLFIVVAIFTVVMTKVTNKVTEDVGVE